MEEWWDLYDAHMRKVMLEIYNSLRSLVSDTVL
jgi:hypothetical protein